MKLSLLRAYISTHKLDVTFFSETYLDYDTREDDGNLKTAVYSFTRVDHSSNTKRGGVCIYYKRPAFRLLNLHYLKEWINFEISFRSKIILRITSNVIQIRLQTKSNIYKLYLVTPIINHKICLNMIKKLMKVLKFSLQQLIKEPTHILTYSSSCIDLLFTY